MAEYALGPVKALCPSVGENQHEEGRWDGVFQSGNWKPENRKGITFKM